MLEPKPLSNREQDVYDLIVRYNRATGEDCPVAYVARKFDVHHSTIQQYIETIHRKGWLHTANSPARARRWLGKRRITPAKSAVPQPLRESDTPQP